MFCWTNEWLVYPWGLCSYTVWSIYIQIKGNSETGGSVQVEERIVQDKSGCLFKLFCQLASLFSYFLFIGNHFVNLDARWKSCRFLQTNCVRHSQHFSRLSEGLDQVFSHIAKALLRHICSRLLSTARKWAAVSSKPNRYVELSACSILINRRGEVVLGSAVSDTPPLWPAGVCESSRLLLNWGIAVEGAQPGDFRQEVPGSPAARSPPSALSFEMTCGIPRAGLAPVASTASSPRTVLD